VREPVPDYSCGPYERPNQAWVCGLAGEPCSVGPTAGGRCPALAECAPLRDGDRWRCNRSALRGGVCEQGPTFEGGCARVRDCRPVRSLRAVRARFVTGCTLLAAGGLLIVLSSDWRNDVIAPGGLALSHAQLMDHRGGEPQCAACHTIGEKSFAGWAASLATVGDAGPSQSQLCLECHDQTLQRELALSPHNMRPEALQQLTDALGRSRRGAISSAVNSLLSPGGEVACAVCHREHHGSKFDLTAMDNAACQACHQQRYASFAADHPDFGLWPYERRTRIVFNHASHRAKHFVESKQAFDCRQCHIPDATGVVQLTASYERSCAACHDERIAVSVARGVPMFALPMLDVAALQAAGHDIGDWPAEASGDFDGRLPPMMRLLLAGDPAAAAAEAMAELSSDLDFFDVDADDPEQLRACATLAAAIKLLVHELATSAPESVRRRLSTALGREVTEAEAAALVAGLSADTLRGAAAWLPDAADSGRSMGRVPRDPPSVGSADLAPLSARVSPKLVGLAALDPAYAPAGAWFWDDSTLTIRYRPAAHADPVFTSWLEILATAPNLERQPVIPAVLKELTNPTAAGLCVSCHSVEQAEGRPLTINWRAHARSAGPRTFTKFSHGPHLVLSRLSDCTACHAINDAADTTASYVDVNPQRFVSEFLPMSKRQCVECHTATAAGDACQSCHNYHVGSGVFNPD